MIYRKFIFLSFLSFLTITPHFYGTQGSTNTEEILTFITSMAPYYKKVMEPEATASAFDATQMAHISQLISYSSVEQFIQEPDNITEFKNTFVSTAHQKGILIRVTPTDAMLMSYNGSYAKSQLKSYTENNPKLLPLLTQLIHQESEELSKNNHIFYHGLRKNIYMNMYIHTKILELISPINPHFLMLRSPVSDYSPAYLPSILRTHFVSNGSKDGDWTTKDRYHLLSTNHSIFGNLYNEGECTLSYFLSDRSCKKVEMSYESLFTHYGIEDVYKKYARALEVLTINSPSGILLQISLTHNLTQKICYLSKPGGYKATLSNKKSFFSWTRNQSHRDQIITKPGTVDKLNRRQWRLVLTGDLLLNPHNQDLKITAYTLEQESLNEFHAKVDAIFEAIKKELVQQKRTVIKPIKKGWSTNRFAWPLQKLHINKEKIVPYLPYSNKKKSHIIPSIIRDGLLLLSIISVGKCYARTGPYILQSVKEKRFIPIPHDPKDKQNLLISIIAWLGWAGLEFMIRKDII